MSNKKEQTERSKMGVERYAEFTDRFISIVEMGAATVFAVLFLIGVLDLCYNIALAIESGQITRPLVVIGFIDTGLLLLIIVEVYQTVLAYVKENETRQIVRLVIYTGVIAMVRKIIIFRTGEYATKQDALFVAVSYTIIVFGLIGLLIAERSYGGERFVSETTEKIESSDGSGDAGDGNAGSEGAENEVD